MNELESRLNKREKVSSLNKDNTNKTRIEYKYLHIYWE